MAIVASGTVVDRPFGRTIAAIAQRRFTGDLRLAAGGQAHAIGFQGGLVVAAIGSHAADGAVKTALNAGLITSSQASAVLGAIRGKPDDVAVVAEHARLAPEQAARLRRRVIANRAMRLLAFEAGEFVLDDAPTLPVDDAVVPIDARVIVYLGVRAHAADARLLRELAALGDRFRLRDDAPVDDFGFGDAEAPVLDALRSRPLAPAEVTAIGEPRVGLAILYALASFGCCEVVGRGAQPMTRATAAAPAPAAAPVPAAPRRARIAVGKGPGDADTIRKLVNDKLALMNGGADHFTLLGVTEDTPAEKVRSAYFDIARLLHPDRITATALDEIRAPAQRLFAHINAAFAVLSNPTRRAEYLAVQRAGGEEAVRRREAEAEDKAMKILAAEEHFRSGEIALRRQMFDAAINEFRVALELNPDEAEHHALLAWATFCAAADKPAAAQAARPALEKARGMAPRNPVPSLLLGKLARALDQDEEAVRHFRRALELSPGHGEAIGELRIAEARVAAGKLRR